MQLFKKYYLAKNKSTSGSLLYYIDISNPLCYNGDPVTLNDISGNSRILTMVNGPNYSSKGFVFDGVNDYGSTNGLPDIRFAAGFSAEIYFEVPVLASGYKELFAMQNGIVTGSGFRMDSLNGGIRYVVGGVSDYSTGITLVPNTKTHIMFTVFGNTLKCYLNGSLTVTTTIANQGTPAINTVSFAYAGTGRYANMKLYQSRIFTSELTASQVLACYNETTPKFI